MTPRLLIALSAAATALATHAHTGAAAAALAGTGVLVLGGALEHAARCHPATEQRPDERTR